MKKTQRLAWAITGSGHYLRESLELLLRIQDKKLGHVDIFLSKAAAEIIKQYGFQSRLDATSYKVYFDKTASSVPVEGFYAGKYHTLIIAPATSNTVAKMAYGFSDSLVANLYAQAGKTRVPSVIFACDTIPKNTSPPVGEKSIISEAPRNNYVSVFPRKVDLQNVQKLAKFEYTQVVESIDMLWKAISMRLAEHQNNDI